MTPTTKPTRVRVLPDVDAIRREFDYEVPAAWHDDGRADGIDIGTMVRADLHGRRIAGWVVGLDPSVDDHRGVALRPLTRRSGVGPPAEVIDLARWAAHRWAGPVASLLRTASPPTMVPAIPAARSGRAVAPPDDDLVTEAFSGRGAVVRVAPLGDRWPIVLGAVARGNALIVVPSPSQVHVVAGRLRRLGIAVGVHPRDWAAGAAGATIVGGRTAAFAPVADLAAIVMIDEHDEVYQDERAPTWHAREVLIERARRAGVPCVLTSPIPTPEARQALPLLRPSRSVERAGWPLVHVVDPRIDDTARGTLWTDSVTRVLRAEGRVAVILNRKGRARLLACRACDALAVCGECDGAMRLDDDDDATLVCHAHGHRRPLVCASCGGTRFKNLRIGVSRAREELEALVREPVDEVSADDDGELPTARVMVGTSALLHRVEGLAAVVFADFDQELVAPRHRAAEEAMGLIVRAGRLVSGRRDGSGQVLVQTRQPDHPVIRAAVAASVDLWSDAEAARRRVLRYPPFAAIAEISGPAAGEYVARLGSPLGVEVRGPVDGRWLVRASSSDQLADALDRVERPKGRVRVAVDPLRI